MSNPQKSKCECGEVLKGHDDEHTCSKPCTPSEEEIKVCTCGTDAVHGSWHFAGCPKYPPAEAPKGTLWCDGGKECRCICHQTDYPLPKDFPKSEPHKDWREELKSAYERLKIDFFTTTLGEMTVEPDKLFEWFLEKSKRLIHQAEERGRRGAYKDIEDKMYAVKNYFNPVNDERNTGRHLLADEVLEFIKAKKDSLLVDPQKDWQEKFDKLYPPSAFPKQNDRQLIKYHRANIIDLISEVEHQAEERGRSTAKNIILEFCPRIEKEVFDDIWEALKAKE